MYYVIRPLLYFAAWLDKGPVVCLATDVHVT